jgi:SAM-dependent methyltransferase
LHAADLVEAATGRSDPLQPPRHLGSVGAGDFEAVGVGLLDQLRELGGLRPDAAVLDVGCGVGRVALPLTGYLTSGRYDGLDISAPMVEWCRRAIGTRFPRFRFEAIDVANTHYNPRGAGDARTARFPYPDGTFDFAFATSLFTHMRPAGFANYIAELARVLVDGGTAFATFFLMTDDSRRAVRDGRSDVDLRTVLNDPHTGIPYNVADARSPETAVGLDERFVSDTLAATGLHLESVHHGHWYGGPVTPLYQDVVVARRGPAAGGG